jgi:ElaB/YqjD/DUF883 family membrane-anchored ribosome-binding protein
MNKKTVVTLCAILLCAGSHMNANGGYLSKSYDLARTAGNSLKSAVMYVGEKMPSKSAVVDTASSIASGAKKGACYVGKKVAEHPYIVAGTVASVGLSVATYKWIKARIAAYKASVA